MGSFLSIIITLQTCSDNEEVSLYMFMTLDEYIHCILYSVIFLVKSGRGFMPQLLQACHPFTYPTSHSLPGLDGGHILRNRSCPKLSSCVGLIFSGFLLFYHLASLPPVFILLLLLVLCHPSLFPSALLLLLALFRLWDGGPHSYPGKFNVFFSC